jgi:hypothetical protein
MARVNNEQAEAEIRNRRPFDNNNGTLSGGRRFRGWGALPAHLRFAVAQAGVAYWVYSYETPIAWVDHEGDVTMPDIDLNNPASAAHQRIAAQALEVKVGR